MYCFDSAAIKGYGSWSSPGSNCTESSKGKKWHGSASNEHRGTQTHYSNPVLSWPWVFFFPPRYKKHSSHLDVMLLLISLALSQPDTFSLVWVQQLFDPLKQYKHLPCQINKDFSTCIVALNKLAFDFLIFILNLGTIFCLLSWTTNADHCL